MIGMTHKQLHAKIILIGLPKAGTSSFQYLFETLGLRSYHWTYKKQKIGSIMKKNKQDQKPLLSGISGWDCITQMDVCLSSEDCYWPQVVDLDQLYEENKDCIFILNKRDTKKMLRSWKKWGEMDQRLYRFNGDLIEDKTDDGLIDFFHKHFERVERFFRSKPDAKFLTFDIEKDSIVKLKQFDIDIKNFTSFPQKNQNKTTIKDNHEEIPKHIWLWWEQGWEHAPFICNYTRKSFEQLNPEFKINLVSKANIGDYIDNYEWIFECQGAAFRADIIRLLLLRKYGGVYSDAATFCCVNILKFMKEIKFKRFWGFDIKSYIQRPDGRTLASWFYISTPNNYIINTFTKEFVENAKKQPIRHKYYLHHFTLTDLIKKDELFQKWYDDLIKVSMFQNRIHVRYLTYPVQTILKKEKDWFHPKNIQECLENKSFKIIKLRHRKLPDEDKLTQEGTIFHSILSNHLY